LGILFLVVLVAVLIARGRNRTQAMTTDPAWEDKDAGWNGDKAMVEDASASSQWPDESDWEPPYSGEGPFQPLPPPAPAEESFPAPAQESPMYHVKCPACTADFSVAGPKPIKSVCPGCGRNGILR
jgi:hypothetical protein